MGKPCKDCKDCNCSKYNKIKRPDFYVMGVDNKPNFQYIIPVNDAEGNLPKSFYFYDLSSPNDETGEWETDSNNAGYGQFLLQSPLYAGGVWNTIQEGINYVTTNPEVSNIPSADGVVITVNNPNYGNTLMEDPSFLLQEWEPYQQPYESLKDPSWLLSFPVCSIKNKFESNEEWRLKDCGIWKIEWRLRVRPVIPLSCYDPSACVGCDDFGFNVTGINPDNYRKAKEAMRFYKSLHAQEGAKALGLSEMRIETGIYSHDTNQYNPVVWSEGGYPQPLINERRYWSSDRPKDMSYAAYSDINTYTKTPFCTDRETWFVGSNVSSITTNSYNGSPNEDDINYVFNPNITSLPGVGRFSVGTNSFINPGTLTFSITDNVGGSALEDWINGFNFDGNGTKIAEMEIEIQGKAAGVWDTATFLQYDVSNISFTPGTVVLSVNSNSSNPTFDNSLGAGHSSTQFFNYDSIDTRYLITLTNTIPGETTSSFNIANVTTQNYTPLTEDFSFELEGFTHVDLDKDRDVSIYLKILPEHNDYGSGGINYVHNDINDQLFTLRPWYSTVDNNANANVSVTPSPTWPWAPLSVDYRNGWKESANVKYEPFLPLDIDRFNTDTPNSRFGSDSFFRRGYNFSLDTKGWYVMIEEGWVRAEKVCEDCEC